MNRPFLSRRWVAIASLAIGLPLLAEDPKPKPVDLGGLNADSFYGKEPTEGVYVRDSAGAVEKLALAQKMERLKEWNKSADLYQEVIVKYADRVVPSQLDKDKKIYQYTSITNPVQERLAHWPQEGLDAYRARFETPAQALLDNARPDDVATLNKVYSVYFVTEAGKQAGIRLIDLYMERGEYPAAAWLGDRLLNLHPVMGAERSAVLYRTALAYYYSGDAQKAKDRLDQLKSKFGAERGVVRGKEVLLADSLAQEIIAPVSGTQSASADSWPIFAGDLSRSRISTAAGRPGARLYGISLSKPNWPNTSNNKDAFQKAYEDSINEGLTMGVMPVADRGELFFQDGQRLYGLSIESGVPLPGWSQTYANGHYTLPGVWGSPRAYQLTTTLTDHEVLAIMGQPDLQAAQFGMQISGEPRLVCLDRQSGKEKWTVALSQLPDSAKDARTLRMTGSPLAIGDSVLVIARGAKTQFEDCYVLAFDISTGKLRWSTYIASASSGIVMWGGMGTMLPGSDNASHLAYANGRVYVQTNLGALAALDAYSGAVAWLDIYPTGRQAFENQRFNPFGGPSSANQAPAHKPWAYNPVIVSDGLVFSLPTEGRNLLIYDAATGFEVKRIDVKDVETKVDTTSSSFANLDTLLGVVGDKLLLSGNSGVVCLNWKNYEHDKFDPEHDNITVWIEPLPKPVMGRGFVLRDSVYIPCGDRLYRLMLTSGRAAKKEEGIGEYPLHPASWEKPEEPGNVVATNDHVIIAGAKTVNVYTDLTLAMAKLDREVAASPTDPQPRLRYAEVMFVAGEGDSAITRLDEAAELLGGLKSLQSGANRDRLFNDALNFADKLSHSTHDEDRQRSVKFYDRAGAAAQTAVQQVHYRLSRAKYLESTKDFGEAVKLYQQILADAQMRPVPLANENALAPLQAEGVATKAIGLIMKDHPGAYESFEQAASAAMEEAKADKDHAAGKLLEIARTYPNSSVAGKAMIAAAESYETASQPRLAVRVLRDMWYSHPESPDKARLLESMARNYLIIAGAPRGAAGHLGPMDNMEAAAANLARATSGDPKLTHELKLPDGTTIETGTPFSAALEKIRKYRGQQVTKVLPDLSIMIPPAKVPGEPKKPHPKAFLATDPKRDVLANIKALLTPIRDFGRSDRIVALAGDNALDILKSGEIQPAAQSHAFSDEPKACAWVGDSLLVWGGSQLMHIKSADGELAWKIDLREMAPIEVVRIGDNAQTVQNPNPDVFVNGQVAGGIRVRGGQRVIFRPGGRVIVPVQPQIGPQQPRAVAGTEEVIDVRPVGDHVLITTTVGRILSAELSSGHIAWQTRLSDRPVDRLVANEDFAVVRISDDAAVRLAAFDTVTGKLRCTRSWVVQSGIVPVNLALAADGTLVYTMQDRLCLKDLYKPWPDPSDKEVQAMQSNPGAPLFQKATDPDHLLIAEGRILALADNGTVKYVRVHSLETGQPVPLKYHSPQGDKEVDRELVAGKSEKVALRLSGSHLYVVTAGHIYSYDLDHPAETWGVDPDELELPLKEVADVTVAKGWLAVVDAEANDVPFAVGGPPVPVPPQVGSPGTELEFAL